MFATDWCPKTMKQHPFWCITKDKEGKVVGPVSQHFHLALVGRKRAHTTTVPSKGVGEADPGDVVTLPMLGGLSVFFQVP